MERLNVSNVAYEIPINAIWAYQDALCYILN